MLEPKNTVLGNMQTKRNISRLTAHKQHIDGNVSILKGAQNDDQERNPDETICAFVIFNNEESIVRALEDYTGSEYIWNRLSQPKHLRFLEEYPLIVKEAPDPHDIIWENLEATSGERNRARSCITTLGTMGLLLTSFCLCARNTVFCGCIFRSAFGQKFCDVALPQAYLSPFKASTAQVLRQSAMVFSPAPMARVYMRGPMKLLGKTWTRLVES